MASIFTLQIIFKKLLLIKFWCVFKEEYQQLSGTIKISLSFLGTSLCEARFSSTISTKITYLNSLTVEVDVRIRLLSIMPNIRNFQKYKTMSLFSLNFLFGEIVIFHRQYVYANM